MEIGNVKGETRRAANRSQNRRLRRGGMIPAVIYGHGEAAESVAVSLHDLSQSLLNKAHVIRLNTGTSTQQYLIKEVQYDHLQRTPIHVDLMRVSADEKVHVSVPLELRGTPAGAATGGVLVQVLSDLQIECLLLEIPDSIRPNVAHLHIGDHLEVKDLELPKGVRALHQPHELVAVVRMKEAAVEAPVVPVAEGETQEPEVIGRVAKEKPEGEEEK
ncbi:MAG: 50S ribosomal protein L25 [Phycisphaerae bacterium]|nr:50S ribosomal protein L25 [Phycisphaerae bacterium]